jgi:single-stranded-DNA-specific exonuclease
VAGPATAFRTEPYSYAEARALAQELGVSEPVAITLVRRGYRTVEAAREFLTGDERHDPFAFDSMAEVCERLAAAIEAKRRITVHGDYDVDGVCSTSILVRALRELGAECDWYLPDRLGDGYGLSVATVERLAAAGTSLLLTADCGIGCAAEIARARELGLEAIVTDHHVAPERLPECPILHPVVSGYPFPELCATGVAYKLSAALCQAAGRDAAEADDDLDLVALATVADLVPLRGENRSLVRRGLAELRRARRPGIRALIAVARVEPERLDEGDLAFRLAPRINAAGRLYRADAGVELMLTADESRATSIAAELDKANYERRDTEREVEQAAEAARAKLPEELREAPALVLAGSGWHPGVVGIVASRLVERHGVPTVLIALDGGRGRGSGRSIPGFDLLAGLEACSEHLLGFGGHRAAAGVEIEAAKVDAFREAFVAHAREVLRPEDLVRAETVDAVVSGGLLGHSLAEEIERLAPFGMGNPGVRLLVPAAHLADVRPMGKEGKHARFSLNSGSGRALGVAFGTSALPEDEPLDLSVRLELNHWNGAVEPRVVLKEHYTLGEPNGAGGACEHCADHAGDEEWWGRVVEALEASQSLDSLSPGAGDNPQFDSLSPGAEGDDGEGPRAADGVGHREAVHHPPGSAIATIAELVSSGESVLALCADASRRRALALHAASPERFGGATPAVACGRCPDGVLTEQIAAGDRLAMTDYTALARRPDLAGGPSTRLRLAQDAGRCEQPSMAVHTPGAFDHVVLVDPPPFPELESLLAGSAGLVHVCWGDAEREFALGVHESEWGMRDALADVYRTLRDAGGAAADTKLATILTGPSRHPRSAELAGRCLRVLSELGVAQVEPGSKGHACSARVVSSEGTNLERSQAFIAYRARYEEGKQYLSRPRKLQ